MRQGGLRVHLWHHQGHRRIHAEGTGVIDHHSALLHRHRGPLTGHRTASRGQHQINASEGFGTHRLHGQALTFELHRLASRAGRGQQAQLLQREGTLLKQGQ